LNLLTYSDILQIRVLCVYVFMYIMYLIFPRI